MLPGYRRRPGALRFVGDFIPELGDNFLELVDNLLLSDLAAVVHQTHKSAEAGDDRQVLRVVLLRLDGLRGLLLGGVLYFIADREQGRCKVIESFVDVLLALLAGCGPDGSCSAPSDQWVGDMHNHLDVAHPWLVKRN